MEASIPDVEMADSPGSGASSSSSSMTFEAADTHNIDFAFPDAMQFKLMPGTAPAFTDYREQLMTHYSGEATQLPHNNTNNAPVSQFPQFDPRALLNPRSPTFKRPASSGGEADRGRTDPTVAGQVSLVERLHNVQERTASPAKRLKTEEDRKKATNGASFGGGSALDLQQRNGQLPTQPGPAIDLTMSKLHNRFVPTRPSDMMLGDDDELQVVGDNMNQTICIGMVRQAYVQAHTVPFPDPKKYLGNSGQQGKIKISFRRGGGTRGNVAIMVTDPTGREFGKVDLKTANGLCPLIDASKVNGLLWMAWTEGRKKQPGEGPPGTQFSGLISMHLQLYCPRRHAHDIGKYLKAKNIFLMRPRWELQRYDYYNPQDGDSLSRDIARAADFQPALFSQQGSTAGAPTSNIVLRSVEEIRADVADVFDTVVNSSEGIPTREPSTHIKTELYPHQKQALYFMWDKEQDHNAEEYDGRKDTLWKPHYRDNGRKSYIHVITGEELAAKPKPCRGGILADEMGLGKTLSISGRRQRINCCGKGVRK
jgi:hypothetical protein